jgi:hypothetical protein
MVEDGTRTRGTTWGEMGMRELENLENGWGTK